MIRPYFSRHTKRAWAYVAQALLFLASKAFYACGWRFISRRVIKELEGTSTPEHLDSYSDPDTAE